MGRGAPIRPKLTSALRVAKAQAANTQHTQAIISPSRGKAQAASYLIFLWPDFCFPHCHQGRLSPGHSYYQPFAWPKPRLLSSSPSNTPAKISPSSGLDPGC